MYSAKNCVCSWQVLINQVFLGSDHFVNEVKVQIEDDKDLSEISFAQKKPRPKTRFFIQNAEFAVL